MPADDFERLIDHIIQQAMQLAAIQNGSDHLTAWNETTAIDWHKKNVEQAKKTLGLLRQHWLDHAVKQAEIVERYKQMSLQLVEQVQDMLYQNNDCCYFCKAPLGTGHELSCKWFKLHYLRDSLRIHQGEFLTDFDIKFLVKK